MNHDQMMEITKKMPMRQIDVNGKPYLQRYFAGSARNGDLWVHRFMSADSEPHLHNHPFEARSEVVVGWYSEETPERLESIEPPLEEEDRITGEMLTSAVEDIKNNSNRECHLVDGRRITPFCWHRIMTCKTDTWSLFFVEPMRLPFWYFMDSDDNLTAVKSSPRDWWKSCKPRQD